MSARLIPLISSPALLLLLLLGLCLFLAAPQVLAQAPVPRRRVAYAQEGDSLYIQGGFTSTTYSAQFNALDLSAAWQLDAPAWKFYKDGPLLTHHDLVYVAAEHSAGLGSGKNGYLLTIGGMSQKSATIPVPAFYNSYDLETATWAAVQTTTPSSYPLLEGHAAAVDPATGLVYIIGGYNNGTYNGLIIFDPASRTLVSQQAASGNATSLTDAAAVWSTVRKSVLTFGGSRAPLAVTDGLELKNLNEYDPAGKAWKTLVTTGAIPTRRLDHCVAASEDGSQIYLFGGSLDSKTYFSDLYVLDVNATKWRQLSAAYSPRTRMACAFHSGQFIAWGGSSDDSRSTMHNMPIIYDAVNDTWVNNYAPQGQPAHPTSDGSGNNTPGSENRTQHLGAIVGGVCAAVVVMMGVIIGNFVKSRRKTRAKKDREREDIRAGAYLADEDNYRDNHGYHSDPQATFPPQQQYPNINTFDNHDVESKGYLNYGASQRHLGQIQAAHHSAAVEALQGGRARYLTATGAGTGSGVRPTGNNPTLGYWDTLPGFPESDAGMRSLSGADIPMTQNPYSCTARPNAKTTYGSSPKSDRPAAQCHEFYAQQGGYISPQPSAAVPYLYKAPYDEKLHGNKGVRASMMSQESYAHPEHHQQTSMSGASPYASAAGRELRRPQSTYDSASTYSDSRNNMSTARGPHQFTRGAVDLGYVPPPP
ncbi:hypothetical protein EDD11_003930 [Mortierella claussenii]|nr:hypothetical protein EDD11_003930 [Mortierella claussenii]